MNKLIWKLLREHISIGQLTGFFFANLIGMIIILLSIQFYRDTNPLFTQGDSFMSSDYIIASKRISTLGSLTGRSNTFSPQEIEELRNQPFTEKLGVFTPTLFNVSAGVSMPDAGIQLSTAMFFESVPDEFIDVNLTNWQYDEETQTVPIIVPRNYLNLYNFGFAQSRNLPTISEGVVGLVNMDIVLRGNGQTERLKGRIAGFSNRLNTILVPQSFMEWANERFAPGKQPEPSRVIIETANPADEAIAQYFQQKGYDTEGNNLDAGRTSYFLRLIVGIVMTVGIIISALSLYILVLSIFLLLQKNSAKLESLLMIGYSPVQISLPYQLLTAGLNLLILILSLIAVFIIRSYYMGVLQQLFPQLIAGTAWTIIGIGILLFLIIAVLNWLLIRRYVSKLFFSK